MIDREAQRITHTMNARHNERKTGNAADRDHIATV
jgi:hypothetical protein